MELQFELKKFAKFKHVVIQCHNIPDADTIGAGFALQCFLRSLGTESSLVYGGPSEIQSPSLLVLLKELEIQISHASVLPPDTDLLITVDCQYGAANVQKFDLPSTAAIVIIDHHSLEPGITENENTIIRPYLASCATLVWDLLNKEGFAIDSRVRNALYYGLFVDTNGLSELRHPLDRDLAEIDYDAMFIRKLKSSAITDKDLNIISRTLHDREIISGVDLFRAEPCSRNLLGFAADIVRQVVGINCCVIYSLHSHEIKLSIRSNIREVMAGEMAEFLCAGGGGGSMERAGGFISFEKIAQTSEGQEPEVFLKNRVKEYMNHFDLIYAGKNDINFAEMKIYKKLPKPVGFVRSTDIFPSGSKITVRTLEGDVDKIADENLYLMIGVEGEIYPIKRENFEASYDAQNAPYLPKSKYTPAILNRISGESKKISPYAKTCIPKAEKLVRAKMLERSTKVFTEWDTEKYFKGGKGDWLVANEGSYDDCYIVIGDIFADTYARV